MFSRHIRSVYETRHHRSCLALSAFLGRWWQRAHGMSQSGQSEARWCESVSRGTTAPQCSGQLSRKSGQLRLCSFCSHWPRRAPSPQPLAHVTFARRQTAEWAAIWLRTGIAPQPCGHGVGCSGQSMCRCASRESRGSVVPQPRTHAIGTLLHSTMCAGPSRRRKSTPQPCAQPSILYSQLPTCSSSSARVANDLPQPLLAQTCDRRWCSARRVARSVTNVPGWYLHGVPVASSGTSVLHCQQMRPLELAHRPHSSCPSALSSAQKLHRHCSFGSCSCDPSWQPLSPIRRACSLPLRATCLPAESPHLVPCAPTVPQHDMYSPPHRERTTLPGWWMQRSLVHRSFRTHCPHL
mmetsp:Transcript_67722/g.185705  ORF Transcript_67722/g.185705 Transcript_67722/m.185705 type:complete len:352 (+) Transcript_67722:785-1840(+)